MVTSGIAADAPRLINDSMIETLSPGELAQDDKVISSSRGFSAPVAAVCDRTFEAKPKTTTARKTAMSISVRRPRLLWSRFITAISGSVPETSLAHKTFESSHIEL
jgi:hypothetical protein